MLHAPLATQHDPVGCGHGFGVQLPPLVQVPVQLACVVMLHAPLATQHDPLGCEQGLGEQVPPLVHVPVQLA